MFSESEQIKICQILGITTLELDSQLIYLGNRLTLAKQEAILEEIENWGNGVSENYASFTPTESNKGFNLNANEAKNEVKRNIAVLFDRPDWGSSIGRLQRS